jgi:hypothetical protein
VAALRATGVARVACCQPLVVSLVKRTEPSNLPAADQRWPVCGPTFLAPL